MKANHSRDAILVQKFTRPLDPNGNSKRLYLVYDCGGNVIEAYLDRSGAFRSDLPELPEIRLTASAFNALYKDHKSEAQEA